MSYAIVLYHQSRFMSLIELNSIECVTEWKRKQLTRNKPTLSKIIRIPLLSVLLNVLKPGQIKIQGVTFKAHK